ELLVEMWLPEGSSYRATETEAKRLEAILAADEDIDTFAAYVGNGSPRYYLSLDQRLFRTNFAQFVILTPDVEARDRALVRIREVLDEQFPAVRSRVARTLLGPPAAYPVQFRVLGDDPRKLKSIAGEVAQIVRADTQTIDAHLDWG